MLICVRTHRVCVSYFMQKYFFLLIMIIVFLIIITDIKNIYTVSHVKKYRNSDEEKFELGFL